MSSNPKNCWRLNHQLAPLSSHIICFWGWANCHAHLKNCFAISKDIFSFQIFLWDRVSCILWKVYFLYKSSFQQLILCPKFLSNSKPSSSLEHCPELIFLRSVLNDIFFRFQNFSPPRGRPVLLREQRDPAHFGHHGQPLPGAPRGRLLPLHRLFRRERLRAVNERQKNGWTPFLCVFLFLIRWEKGERKESVFYLKKMIV